MSRTTERVVGWSPVPNAIPGSTTIVRVRIADSAASQGGAMRSSPTICVESSALPRLGPVGVGRAADRHVGAGIRIANGASATPSMSALGRKVRDERVAVLVHALRAGREQRGHGRLALVSRHDADGEPAHGRAQR